MEAGLGDLAKLPAELRFGIYMHLLTSRFPEITTFGSSSIISTSILCCSSALYQEASPLLYNPPGGHVLETRELPSLELSSPFSSMPTYALLRMRDLTVRITFKTHNRGECEREVLGIYYLRVWVEATAFTLRHSTALRRLRIELLNENQRKRGARLVRSDTVRHQVGGLLKCYAECVGVLPNVKVEVGGFDTIEYVEMFARLMEGIKEGGRSLDALIEELSSSSTVN